ncbi:MAG TPA: hypothetical protein VF691_18630 [Cytophagaceae bacterium]|jgi:hypothetical protein
MNRLFFFLTILFLINTGAEGSSGDNPKLNLGLRPSPQATSKLRLFTRSYGFIAGLQGGRLTFIEMGLESHWRKITISKPRLLGISANVEYNWGYNILGYKASIFHKVGRINFTYGLNFNYYTDFDYGKVGLGPVLGFKLFGFHLLNGYNFMFGSKEFNKYNTFYVAIRYFFPLRSKVKLEK